jgi:hypothetical protein
MTRDHVCLTQCQDEPTLDAKVPSQNVCQMAALASSISRLLTGSFVATLASNHETEFQICFNSIEISKQSDYHTLEQTAS